MSSRSNVRGSKCKRESSTSSTSSSTIGKQSYMKVADEEQTEEPIELPLENDGTIALSTLTAQFPGASGLKYRNPETGTFRGLKLDDHSHIHPPPDGWGDLTFIVVFPKENTKRKIDTDYVDSNAAASKQKRVEWKKCSDLIVLGLPYKTTEDELREYFEQFGEVVVSQVKRDPKTDKSKGFGFVRFTDYDSQVKVLSQRHHIDGRWCDVKIPNSKTEQQSSGNRKIFVGRLNENISADDLRDYFGKFGEVMDVFIPKPFRGFGFVTFTDADVAQALCGEDYVIRQCSVHVSPAAPKDSASVTSGSGGGSRQSRQSAVVNGHSTMNYDRSPASPPNRRSDYYNYESGPGSPQAKVNRNQVWASFPSNSMTSSGPYGNPWNTSGGESSYYMQSGNGDAMAGLMAASSVGNMGPLPVSQHAPPPNPVSQNAAANATNQATASMGALNLGSFNMSSLFNQALNPALNPALLAAAQAAILQTLAQTTQTLASGASAGTEISSAIMNSMPNAITQMAGPQPPAVSASASCAPAGWWPQHTTSVAPGQGVVPSSAVAPSSAAALTTAMAGDIVPAGNGNQPGRSVGVWKQDEGWRK